MSSLRAAMLSFALLSGACRDEVPPGYMRIGGPAPAIADVPRTRALLVVFWAAWCAPCREETPALRAMARSAPSDLSVLVISQDPEMDSVTTFLRGPPDPELHLRLDQNKDLSNAFGVGALPASILIIDGQLVARFDGSRDWMSASMRSLLSRLIAEKTGSPSNGQFPQD